MCEHDKKKNIITIIFLLLISSVYAYQYSASQGNKVVYGNDINAHSSVVTIPVRFCNNLGIVKTYKLSLFLDLPIRKIYNYTNKTIYTGGTEQVQFNITRYSDPGNVSYQETVNRTAYKRIPQTVEGYEEVTVTTKKNKKKTGKTTLKFQPNECKEFVFEYDNILLPNFWLPLWKYDIGEDDAEILDPVVNTTNYDFNGTLDNNASRTSAQVISAYNVSNAGNTSYTNDTGIIALWLAEDAAGSSTLGDERGNIGLSLNRPSHSFFGINGYVARGWHANGTTTGAYFCNRATGRTGMNVGPNTLEFWVWLNSTNDGSNTLLAGTNYSSVTMINGGLLNCCVTSPGGGTQCAYGQTNLTRARWYQIACDFNGTEGRIYIDGTLDNRTTNQSFSIADNGNNIQVGGGHTSIACGTGTDCGNNDGGRCLNGTIDQIRWYNSSNINFNLNESRYFTNALSVSGNVTRVRMITRATDLTRVNVSVSLDGGVNYISNMSNFTIYNLTSSVRNNFLLFGHLISTVDWYGANVTLGSQRFDQDINNRNVSHNATLNVTVNCSDGLPNFLNNYTDNTTLFDIGINNGIITDDPAQSDTGATQIRINCTMNNLTTFQTFNYTVFNSGPTISSVTINPSNPTTNDALHCTVTGTDAENDVITGFYNWYRNGVVHSREQNITGGWNQNDVFICEARAFDGLANSTTYSNSTSVRTTSSSGGSGDAPPTPKKEDETPPPIVEEEKEELSLLSPSLLPKLRPPLEEIFKEIPPPEICGDKICSQSERGRLPLIGELFATNTTCKQDCPFDFDVILFEVGRARCFFKSQGRCPDNTEFIFAILIILIILGVLLFLLFGDKKKDKKKKRKF